MNFICPFHKDRTPSFKINKNNFLCFGCKNFGKTINIKNIIIKKFELTFNKEMLILSKINLFKKKNIWLNYLLKRNINFKTIYKFNLGYIDVSINKNKYSNLLKNRLIFPILNEYGIICGIGLNSLNKKYKYINIYKENFNKNEIIFGSNFFKKKYTIVVEGYFDFLILNKFKILNVTSILGSYINLKKINKLISLYNIIYFCMDGDYAGFNASNEILFLKKEKNIKNIFCKILPNKTDPDSFINNFGIKNFLKFIKK